MSQLYITIGLFSLAALLGLILISYVLRSKETPKAAVFAHGVMAAAGLVLLLMYVIDNGPGPWESLVLFVLAALGGFFMFYRDITGRSVPKVLAVAHGLLAVTGFVLLLIFTFSS